MSQAYWDALRGVVRSRKGGWKIGGDVTLHGRSLIRELMPDASWFQVWLLSITGRFPERRLADWCEVVWRGVSYPDPRIWCNQVAALAGSMRCTPVAAVTAMSMTSDALLYTGWAARRAAEFLVEASKEIDAGSTLEAVVAARCRQDGKPRISGFGRPVAHGDERLVPLDEITRMLGFERGRYLTLAYALDAHLRETCGEQMNGGGYVPAFMLDQGFSPVEIHRFYATAPEAGAMACYVDTYDRPPDTFLPMRCEDFDYQGRPPRPFPDRR